MLIIEGGKTLTGEIKVPGDKSISHRSLIFSALAQGESKIKGLLEGEDCLATAECLQKMGVAINKDKEDDYIVTGVGLNGLKEPREVLDCGNSGTTMRLLAGLLAGQTFYSVLSGDDSLRQRPMNRIKDPLSQMGAELWTRNGGLAPLSINKREPNNKLKAISYNSPVASAQVKSAILLAGLYAQGVTRINEPAVSRDHTEKFLQDMGADIRINDRSITLNPENLTSLSPFDISIPGDISSAAFLIAAAIITPNSRIKIKNVGINWTRSGFIDVIKKMGAKISLSRQRNIAGEPVADIEVKSSQLKGVHINGGMIPRLIDEIPVLAVLASQAKGKTVISDAGELRVKETDRILAISIELNKLGCPVVEKPDGMIIEGPIELSNSTQLRSWGDHRIGMALAIASLAAEGTSKIHNSEAINVSFPGFKKVLDSLKNQK
ncbi:MAG: 3-phosphoshikimate 1-carboxyvinyltransferase [Bacillota bacterium]